jgi:hypothetical protein
MDSSDLVKPWKYKDKWYIWPETVLDILEISDCNDTINGICLSGKSVEDCIDQCVGDCAAGYHVQFDDGRTICVPIRTSIHPDLNPVYRLRTQNIYPELSHVKISTYVNTEVFPFPPDSANVVFYQDILTLKDSVYGTTIRTTSAHDEGHSLIYMTKGGDENIQLVSNTDTAGKLSQYEPVRYGEPFQIAVPNTSLLARLGKTQKDTLEWELVVNMFSNLDISFKIISINGEKKLGDVLSYGDIFAIMYSEDSVVVVNPRYDYLMVDYDNLENALEDRTSVKTFQFVSKMMGYYCDGKDCKEIAISDIETSGKYKDMSVGRNPGCWGICNYSMHPLSDFSPQSSRNRLILGMIIFIILSIIFIYLFVKKRA